MTHVTRSSTPLLSEAAKELHVPSGIKSTGFSAVRAQCERLGVEFDTWQDGLGSLILAKRRGGLYAAGVGGVVMSIPRQTGKTYTVGWIAFALCMLQAGLTVIWTAHRTRTANETFQSMRSMSRKPKVAAYVSAVRAANGEQAVLFKNGSRILFGARESGFGRGFAKVDMLVLDEAQILTENAMSDMVPATNAAPNGLVLLMGTPPRPKDPGEVFEARRADALGGDKDTLYVEFGADDGTDPALWQGSKLDWDQIAKANPSFPHRTSKTAVLRMKKLLGSVDNFRREALGLWDGKNVQTAINAGRWGELEIPADAVPSGLKWCAAVRFSIDGATVGVARAGRERGRSQQVHVELATRQGVRTMGDGVQWIVDYLLEYQDRWAQIVVDGKSGAADLIDRLRANGVPSRVIWTPTVNDVISAHSMMDAAIKDGTITHLKDDELASEVGVIVRRKIGNAGGFGWAAPEGATAAGMDAVTLAHWAARTTRRRPKAVKGGKGVIIL